MDRFYEGKYRIEFDEWELNILKTAMNDMLEKRKSQISIAEGYNQIKSANDELGKTLYLVNKLKEAKKNA